MENIYQTWTQFNKRQSQAFKGEGSLQLLEQVQKSLAAWQSEAYPKSEDWKYVPFKKLTQVPLSETPDDEPSVQRPDEDFFVIDIRNFKTPQDIQVAQLPQGLSLVPEVETTEMVQKFSAENPFTALVSSFYGLGFQLKFESSYQNHQPVRLIVDLDALTGKDLYAHQNISIDLSDSVEARVYLDVRSQKFSGLSNLNIFCNLAAESQLSFFSKEQGGVDSYQVSNLFANVAKEALFQSFDLTLPCQWSRHNWGAQLLDEKASVEMRGAYLNDAEGFVDHHTSMRHCVGHTHSFEDYRGILSGKAQAVFNGKVFIDEKAVKSESEQINKNLMLSNTAEVDTKPELQIYNDDVKAAHGATVGQMDEEQRFYLQSRGYDYKQAGQILARAFVYDLLENADSLTKKFYTTDLDQALEQLGEA